MPETSAESPSAAASGEVDRLRRRVAELDSRVAELEREVEERAAEEHRLRRCLENMAEGVVVRGPDGSVRDANPAAVCLLGDVLENMNLRAQGTQAGCDASFVRADGSPMPANDLPGAIAIEQGRAPGSTVLGLRRADGSLTWLKASAAPLVGEATAPKGVICTFADITELRHAEDRARRLAAAVEAVDDIVVIMNTRGELLEVNEATLRMHGIQDKKELLGREVFDLVVPQDRHKAMAALQELLETGRAGPVECQMVAAGSGQIIPVEASGAILKRDARGRPLEAVGVVRDIADRTRAHQVLQEREASISSIFRAAPIGIGVVSDRVLQQVNDEFCDMVGFRREELVGQSARMVYPSDEDYEHVGRKKYRQISETGTGTVETRFLCKDGAIIDVLLSSTPTDPRDLSRGVTFTALDITDRKRTERKDRIRRDLGIQCGAARSLDEVLSACLDAALRISEMDCGGVYLVDQDSGALDVVLHTGLSPAFVQAVSHFDADSPNAQLVMAGKPLYTAHSELPIVLRDAQLDEQLRAIAVVPVLEEGRAIACLNVASHTLEDVPGHARRALESIAGQIASAITRVRAEEALRKSEESFRAIFDGVLDGIILADPETKRFHLGNRSICDMLGYAPHEIRQLGVADVHPEQDLPAVIETFEKQARRELELATNIPVKRRDGSVFFADINTGPFRIHGKTYLMGVFRDVTERKKADEAISAYQKQLRSLAAELSLVEEREKKILASQLHDGIVQDMAFVKLELRRVLGHLPSDNSAAAALERLMDAVTSTIKASRTLCFELSPPLLYEYGLAAALRWLGDHVGQRSGLKVHVQIQEEEPIADEDIRVLLFQVARELLINAEKHAQATEIALRLDRAERDVSVVVQDNGVGFDYADVLERSKVGEHFGLFSIQERVRHSGGALDIVSSAGSGARFTVTVPLKAA